MSQLDQVKELRQRFENLHNELKGDMLFMAIVSFELDIELSEENFDKLSSMYSIYMTEDQYTGRLSEQLVYLAKEVGL